MSSLLSRHWRALLLVVAGCLVVAFVATSLIIGQQVAGSIALARAAYPGDAAAALIALAGDAEAPVVDRDRAVWALGQLGVAEALPVLESLRTGEECEHGVEVCQHGLVKAIDLCGGSFNAGAVIWRHGDLATR
jgi:hypothetical protein